MDACREATGRDDQFVGIGSDSARAFIVWLLFPLYSFRPNPALGRACTALNLDDKLNLCS